MHVYNQCHLGLWDGEDYNQLSSLSFQVGWKWYQLSTLKKDLTVLIRSVWGLERYTHYSPEYVVTIASDICYPWKGHESTRVWNDLACKNSRRINADETFCHKNGIQGELSTIFIAQIKFAEQSVTLLISFWKLYPCVWSWCGLVFDRELLTFYPKSIFTSFVLFLSLLQCKPIQFFNYFNQMHLKRNFF